MKTNLLKSFLATVMLGSMALTAAAEEQAPARLLTEGRSWLYAAVSTFDGDTLGYYRIDVVGDTVANNRPCKKLARYNVDSPEAKTYHAVCEDNGYLYFFHKNPASLNPERADSVPLVDFRLRGGEVLDSYDFAHGGFESDPRQLRVGTPDYVEVDGTPRRRLTLKDENRESTYHWVEGVGASDLLSTLQCSCHSTIRDVFVACYENGRRIFTKEDFNNAAAEAAADYKPLLTDGKSWLMATCQGFFDWGFDTQFMVEVKGNSTIGSVKCKRLVKYYIGREAEVQAFYAYEADRKVYLVTPQDELHKAEPRVELLMDFSMTAGDSKPLRHLGKDDDDGKRIVEEDKTITAQGKDYRMLQILTKANESDGGETGYWVEGVGVRDSRDCIWDTDFLYAFPTKPHIHSNVIMVSCYQDGEKIFDHSDFCGETYTYREPQKILSEGKSWLIAGVRPIMNDELLFKFSVGADTIVGGQPCKAIEIYNTGSPKIKGILHACEINGRVFIVSDEDWSLMSYAAEPGTLLPVMDIAAPATRMPLLFYNFEWGMPNDMGDYDKNQGDYIEVFECTYPDYPNEGDYDYEFGLRSFNEGNTDLPTRAVAAVKLGEGRYVDWVEGIGASVYNYSLLTGWPFYATIDCIDYYYMVECYQDGKCIFTQNDFINPVDGIEEVRTEAAAADGAPYDLQGRRLAKPAPGQLYIRDGRLRRN